VAQFERRAVEQLAEHGGRCRFHCRELRLVQLGASTKPVEMTLPDILRVPVQESQRVGTTTDIQPGGKVGNFPFKPS
jgi:hypothetical protein